VRILHVTPPRTEIAGTRPITTHYCHLQEVLVHAGDSVHPGQAIGLIGSTIQNADGNAGEVTPIGSHLHFGVQVVDDVSTEDVSISSGEEVRSGINPAVWLNELGIRLSEVGYQRLSTRGFRGRTAYPESRPSERRGRSSTDVVVQPKSLRSAQLIQKQIVQLSPEKHSLTQSKQTTNVIQFVRPSYLVSLNYLGIDIPVDRGLHPTMRNRLIDVQNHLQNQYDALPSGERPATLKKYAGIQTIRGWRETTSQHGTGSAVDVNYDDQPYIATRTHGGHSTTYGGEQGSNAPANVRELRRPAVEVYDRAVSFMRTNPYDSESADVGNRRVGESATDSYRRFRRTSDSLRDYLSLAFRNDYFQVQRVPIIDPEAASEASLLQYIPTDERKDEATAIADIEALMGNLFWQIIHPNYPLTSREQYFRILRDYEIVRGPMQYGNPNASPGRTRNPARGFLHLPEHFVVAMMDIGGLRWGACEFSASSNGDVHHFDLREPFHIP